MVNKYGYLFLLKQFCRVETRSGQYQKNDNGTVLI